MQLAAGGCGVTPGGREAGGGGSQKNEREEKAVLEKFQFS